MNPPPAIALHNVNKIYANGTIALQNLNLTILESEFVSLLGPSGCGKSTVLRLIARLGGPTSGSIHSEVHVDLKGDRPRQKLAFVFQEAALMPWATVYENIRLPLKLARLSTKVANRAIDEAIALVHLKGFEKAYPRELSGGMKMRVSIARALVTQPDILLMDEPFGALDEMTRHQLNSDLLDLWNEMRWTVVFVTHSVYEAVYLSHRVVIMAARPGRVIDQIEIDAAYPRPPEFRDSTLYNHYCKRISSCLRQAIGVETSAGTSLVI